MTITSQETEIKNVWKIISTHYKSIVELRAIKKDSVSNKIFKVKNYSSHEAFKSAFEKESIKLNKSGFNIYAVMNPIKESFSGGSVTDKDIQSRDLLLIDIDRSAISKQPASANELQAAKLLADKVMVYLKNQGWGSPIKVMSGNGYHLYYRLEQIPNNEDTKQDIKTFLNNLADHFDNDQVKIDRSVFNSSRITKVVGTFAYKGNESSDRPYRMARVEND